MLKACKYCHKLHELGVECDLKPVRNKRDTKIERFRNTTIWRAKRKEIVTRDMHMCQLCAIGYGNKPIKYNSQIEVHHITPMSEDWGKRLDNNNLISLCHYHHEMAECGAVSRPYLVQLLDPPRGYE